MASSYRQLRLVVAFATARKVTGHLTLGVVGHAGRAPEWISGGQHTTGLRVVRRTHADRRAIVQIGSNSAGRLALRLKLRCVKRPNGSTMATKLFRPS